MPNTTAPPKTKPSTPRLSDVARHVVVPKGVVSTGWPAVRDKCRDLGIEFDEWQHGAGKIILAKRADGKYAATIGGTALSIPRQVGKTFLVGAIVFALCLLNPGMTVIWTAHRLRTAGETFEKMKGMTRRKRIAPHILKVVLGSGEEEIRFRNGSRILFGARERGFGRGFDEVDVLIFDEAQILTENAIDDMVPAMNQSRQAAGGLMLYIGTPPKPTDPGEVFTRMRTEALSGEDEDTGYIEFSADPDFVPTPTPGPMGAEDWRQIAKANASYPKRTPRESILRMRKKLSADSMLREGYGIWDPLAGSTIPELANWGRLSTNLDAPDPAAVAIAADLDQAFISLSAASVPVERTVRGTSDPITRRHLGSVLRMPSDERATFIAEVKRIQDERSVPVLVDAKGPASFLIPDLEVAGVSLTLTNLEFLVQACADICEAVKAGTVEHGNYLDLNAAIDYVGWRKVADRRAFARKSGDISALEAVTLALAGANMPAPTIW